MEGALQRSVISFRRQGSSGLIWNDKLLIDHMSNRVHKSPNEKAAELRPSRSEGVSSTGTLLPQSQTNIGGGSVCKTAKVSSSGLAWNDKLLTDHMNDRANKSPKEKAAELRPSRSGGPSTGTLLPHSQTNTGGGGPVYKTAKVLSSTNFNPPSPKVSGCGICCVFGKPASSGHKPRSRKG